MDVNKDEGEQSMNEEQVVEPTLQAAKVMPNKLKNLFVPSGTEG